MQGWRVCLAESGRCDCWLFNQMQPRKGTARALSEELLALSTRNANSGHTLQARHASWTTNFFLGEFKYAREQTAWGAELYDAAEHRSHKFMYGGHDPGVCSRMFGALSALMMGFPDQALKIMQNGRDLSKTINHPLSLLLGETFLAIIHLLRGEPHEARPILERAIRLATEASIPRGMWANFLSGWTLSGIGRASNGLAQALQDFDVVAAAGQEAFRPFYTGVLAGMCRDAGRVDDGVVLVDKALGLVTTQDSQWCLAELNRIKGELNSCAGRAIGRVGGLFRNCSRHCAQSACHVLGASSHPQPGAPPPIAGQTCRGLRPSCAGIWLVHRRVR